MAILKVLGGYLECEGGGIGEPSHPIYTPPPYPDQGLPPGSPGSPTHPIYIPGAPPGTPGSPSHPIYIGGSPSHPIYIPGYPSHPIVPPGGHPSHPIYLPGDPSHPWVPPAAGSPGTPTHPIYNPAYPDQGLPPGGEVIPPETLPPPAGHEDDMVIAVYKPGQGWTAKAYDVAPDQGQPQPTPHG